MNRIGIKFFENLSYEDFESFQYLLEYDFEYEELIEYIEGEKVILLDIEDDEDREDDLEALTALLLEFDSKEIKYGLYSFSDRWESSELSKIKKV